MVRFLHPTEELQPLLNRMQKTMDYADGLLRDWTKEYTRRLIEAKNPR